MTIERGSRGGLLIYLHIKFVQIYKKTRSKSNHDTLPTYRRLLSFLSESHSHDNWYELSFWKVPLQNPHEIRSLVPK